MIELESIHDVSLKQVEDLLYFEAELLDDWKLMEWSDLFSEQGMYLVQAMNSSCEYYRNTI